MNGPFNHRKRINFAELANQGQVRPSGTGTGSTLVPALVPTINAPIRDIEELIGSNTRVNAQLPIAINNISGKRFVFDITRQSYNIPLELPFVFGCPVAFRNSFRTVFNQTQTMVPGGTVAATYNDAGALVISWTVGGNTDQITIQKKGLTPYVDFMEMMLTDFFGTLGFKYFGPTTNFLLQFQAYELSWGSLSLSGKQEQDTDDVPSFLSEDNFVQYMLPIEISNVFNGRRFMVNGFPATPAVPATATTITLSFITTIHGSSSNYGG